MRIRITDADDPRVRVYRHLNRSRLDPASGLLIAESKLAVERAIASRCSIHSILSDERSVDKLPARIVAAHSVYVAANDVLSQIVGFEFHRGQLACMHRQPNDNLASLIGGDTTSTVVVCPEIADPTNLAGIIRNAAALGAAGVLLGSVGVDPFSRRVVRVSVGNVFRLPIRTAVDLRAELLQLRNEWGYQLVATVLDVQAERLPAFRRAPRTALLFGGEGHGLDAEWIELSDRRVTLPMQGNTDSLNVATASGIFLYHFSTAARLS